MNLFTPLLAQTATTDGAATPSASAAGSPQSINESLSPVTVLTETLREHLDLLCQPEALTNVLYSINIVWAAIFVTIGTICVINGYRWHKAVIVVLAGLAGMWFGLAIGAQIGGERIVAACLGILAALLAWPLMRYAVAVFGGLAGAFAGANIWTAVGLDSTQHPTGALIGLLVVGLLAFMMFRGVVVVLTTVCGSTLLVMGGLAAMFHVEAWQGGLINTIQTNTLLVPIVAASMALIGAIFQFGGGLKGLNQLSDKADPAKGKKTPAAAAQ